MVQQGWPPPLDWMQDPIMRKAVVYAVAMQNCMEVDWTTGAVFEKKASEE